MTRLMELQCGATGKARRSLEDVRPSAVEALRRARDFVPRAGWLQERFPDAKHPDVDGLVKLVERGAVESHVWSLTPGRYVGVASEEKNENLGFDETVRDIQLELEGLNEEAAELPVTIARNFEVLGI